MVDKYELQMRLSGTREWSDAARGAGGGDSGDDGASSTGRLASVSASVQKAAQHAPRQPFYRVSDLKPLHQYYPRARAHGVGRAFTAVLPTTTQPAAPRGLTQARALRPTAGARASSNLRRPAARQLVTRNATVSHHAAGLPEERVAEAQAALEREQLEDAERDRRVRRIARCGAGRRNRAGCATGSL